MNAKMIPAVVPAQARPARRAEREFLPAALEIVETPPSPLGRSIAYAIMALFAIALIWACVGKVDIVAAAKEKRLAGMFGRELEEIAALEQTVSEAHMIADLARNDLKLHSGIDDQRVKLSGAVDGHVCVTKPGRALKVAVVREQRAAASLAWREPHFAARELE